MPGYVHMSLINVQILNFSLKLPSLFVKTNNFVQIEKNILLPFGQKPVNNLLLQQQLYHQQDKSIEQFWQLGAARAVNQPTKQATD